ncbi:MAG: adenine-specific methyltransferase EcoRI family protein [bacterium]|nr:adenine-specific methyltransferase EcoRI family protein [bacterium]
MANSNLSDAKKAKSDEFYTELADIENELKHYKDQFRGKVVFLNCDDPYESNFFKYFASKFNHLGLKKLIATSYAGSPIIGAQLPLPQMAGMKGRKEPLKIEINEVPDADGDGAVDLSDVRHLLENDKNTATPITGNGDFRSDECVKLLQQADIVCTNPPFSLFREYVAQLVEHDKKFLILGDQNAITYIEIFKLIKENKLWLGYDNGGTKWFRVPMDYDIATESRKKVEDGIKYFSMGRILWFTNMDTTKRHQKLDLYKSYSSDEYPKYDNYDAIEVARVADIPTGYGGAMGVPITFIDRYNPEQFDIIGITKKLGFHLRTKVYPNQIQVDANGKRSNVSKLNDGATLKVLKPPTNKTYYVVDGEYFIQLYARVLVKLKDAV